jgi:hypothetical protein
VLRRKNGTFALLTLILSLLGCSTPHKAFDTATPSPTVQVESHSDVNINYEGQFLLSPKQPEHRLARVRLVSVGYRGGTVLQHLDTHRYVHAAPGEFFISEEWGTNGLKLVWASEQAQEAYVTHKWSQQE